MSGFFFSDKDLGSYAQAGCPTCKLDRGGCLSPRMEASGDGKKGILVIAGAPSRTDDEKGIQLMGMAGRVIRKGLAKFGVDLDVDCRKINAVNCCLSKNRTPTNAEITACRPRVWKEIQGFKPKVIILCGTEALESFLDHRWNEALGGIGRWRGWVIPDRDAGAWVIPTFDPSYVGKSKKSPVIQTIFEMDLKKAISFVDVPLRKVKEELSCVKVIQSEMELESRLEKLYKRAKHNKSPVAFDYETTGLKPYAEGHKIFTASICCEADKAYSFVYTPSSSKAREWWRRIIRDPRIPKMAHNIKFEDTWSVVRGEGQIRGWSWCSMQAAHILDNRKKVSSLEFQAYVNFGLLPWSEVISPYLKSKNKGGNSFNTIEKAPLKSLLEYGGVDSLVQYRLAILQRRQIL